MAKTNVLIENQATDISMLLNADVGEGLESDMKLYPFLDQASIACGGHAGDVQTMRRAVAACKKHHVIIGAHPSYPDPDNFGRVSLAISERALKESLKDQIQSLAEVCDSFSSNLCYVKPHGALYNDLCLQPNLFDLILELVTNESVQLDLMLSASLPAEYSVLAEQAGVVIIREAFADRQYLEDSQLAPRTQAGAVFSTVNEICAQVADLKEGHVKDVNGHSVSIKADSICIHGDNPISVESVSSVSQLLKA